jgi:competence protein ComEC
MPAPPPDRPIRWRARPLLLAAVCLASGVAAAPLAPMVAWTAAALAAPIAAGIFWLVQRRRLVRLTRLAVTFCAGLSLFALGGQRTVLWEAGSDAPLADAARAVDAMQHTIPLTITGNVVGSPSVTDRRLRFTLLVDSVGLDERNRTPGRADVTLWQPRDPSLGSDFPELRQGHYVAVSGVLRPLPDRRNPADFDFGAHLRRQRVHAVVTSSDSASVTVLAYRPTTAERAVAVGRAHVRDALDRHVRRPNSRAVLAALLLADRAGIERDVRDGFARTGLAHLLAVSGLHVFLVGMVIYGLLKPFLHRFGWGWRTVEVVRAILTLVLLGSYVAVVGGPASAVRALVMAAALIAGRAFERPANALNSLGAAAIVLLFARPAALHDVGFQLSFSAVGALILLMPVLERGVPTRLIRQPGAAYVTRLALASAAATLGTMPVLLAHFGLVPLAGLVLNIPAIPLTAATLAGGLLTVLFHGWLTPLATAAGAATGMTAGILLEIGVQGERWLGWTAVGRHVTDLSILAALGLSVVLVALWERPRHRWRTACIASGCLAIATWGPLASGDARPVLDVVFLDVGQGDAVLMTLPGGRTLLVDAGPWDPYGDAGTRVLLPHLERFGIRRLDAVVVSHPHSDHLGGVPTLLENMPVSRLFYNGDHYESEQFVAKRSAASRAAVPMIPLAAGDTLSLDPSMRIHVLHPGPEPDAHANDASVVLRVTFGDISFLLTGDVEAAAEAALVARYGDHLCSDVVKVPHHGSSTSSTTPFVRAASGCGRTAYAVVPVARRNRYNLPREEALARWRTHGAQVLLTGQDGAVWLRTDGRSVRPVRWRPHRPHS